ncbi:MAG: S8 family serine peptidase [Roseiflexus sp.]|nr:S8 family serine peptidase [Roseiflexus sp.]
MRRIVPVVVLITILASAWNYTSATVIRSPITSTVSSYTSLDGSFVPNEILISLKPEFNAQVVINDVLNTASFEMLSSLNYINQRHSVKEVTPLFDRNAVIDALERQHGLDRIYKVVFPPEVDIFTAMADYRSNPAIEYAEPHHIYQIMQTAEPPNDPEFPKQWGLHNTGQTGGRVDADIDAPEAWTITKGSSSILIAVIDTGVNYKHPDLQGDRVRTDLGFDFVNNDRDAMDDHGHGTFVAGIIAANTNNKIGIAGVCPECQLIPIKVLNKEGKGKAEWVAQGIQHAAQSGARIINMSLGFPSHCGCSQTVARTINFAHEKGSLLIAASGNDSDKRRTSYPASSPRVMAVGATDHTDKETGFSNRDSYLDVLAPGKDIRSLHFDGGYDTASGTSAAAPFVAGVAGLILAANPNMTNVQLWWRIYQSADDFPTSNPRQAAEEAVSVAALDPASVTARIFLPFISRTRTVAGRLNAERALKFQDPGQMFAPVDTCSGEPSCTPGCGAEVALSSSPAATPGLHTLRRFRDEKLASSPVGQQWIDIYERHRLELAMLLASDPHLRKEVRSALEIWMPLFDALTNGHSTDAATIRSEHIQAARTILEQLNARGSEELRRDLPKAANIVDRAETFIGQSVSEFWQAITKE